MTAKSNKTGSQQEFKPFIKTKSPILNESLSQPNFDLFYKHPMRLKDYETNFQAYKVMSQLIDQQMKWEPKKKRPRSSVSFRRYNIGIKA